MDKYKLNINEVINEVKKNDRIFCSEADFQHTLALAIMNVNKDDIKKIFLEYPFEDDNKGELDDHNHLDILIVLKNDKMIPIELKYKTTYPNANRDKDKHGKLYQNTKEKIKFRVKDQKAKNYGCYNYIKDIYRIESFRDNNVFKENFEEGYAIFLTNDKSYWEEVDGYIQEQPIYDYSMFSIHHNRKNVHGTLNWKKPKEKYREIDIKGNYDFKWKLYYKNCKKYNSEEDFGEFKYLITKIKK